MCTLRERTENVAELCTQMEVYLVPLAVPSSVYSMSPRGWL